jgi:hypothetical protein
MAGTTTTTPPTATSGAPGALSSGGASGATAAKTGGSPGMGETNTGGVLGGVVGTGGDESVTAGGGAVTAGGAGGAGPATGGTSSGGSGASSGGSGASSGGTVAVGSGGALTDTVTRKASTYTFKHFPVQTNSDGVWNGPTTPGNQPTISTYETIVLENAYLRVTILPSYGGRVLSILHKPTNRELLYQNPLGTPYLMQEDIFYYDYLVILGGIFPSFPEPEHGRYWNQPYDFEIVSESAGAITVRMSRKDDRDIVAGIPARYDVGRTDVLVQLDVTLRAGSAALELDTKLTNTRSSAVSKFEYWTVTTLAPGSTPGQTAIPLNTRILANMSQVHLLESSWSWFGQAEERISGEVFKWKNLSSFANWADQGTAFANPSYTANWSGLSNHENDTSILRVSDNTKTPGLKLWTFGKQSLDVDIDDSQQWLRPTIEMWHGVTPEFWNRGSLSANEVRSFSERYFPTFGLREITAASEYGAVNLSHSASGSDTTLRAAATLVLPNQLFKVILRLDDTVVSEQDVVASPTEATTVSATVPSAGASPGSLFEAEFLQGNKSVLTAQIALE